MAVSKELLEKLDQWHEENKHKEIVREIGELPEELRQDYDIQGRLARALNNTGKYKEAMAVLESVRQIGEQDHRWWSRMGYAYYQLDRMEEAKECFLTAQRLDPDNEDARTFLAWMNVGPSGKSSRWRYPPGRSPYGRRRRPRRWTCRRVPRSSRPKRSGRLRCPGPGAGR